MGGRWKDLGKAELISTKILCWIKIEAYDQARGAGSHEIFQCIVRSLSLGELSGKIIQGVGTRKKI